MFSSRRGIAPSTEDAVDGTGIDAEDGISLHMKRGELTLSQPPTLKTHPAGECLRGIYIDLESSNSQVFSVRKKAGLSCHYYVCCFLSLPFRPIFLLWVIWSVRI